MFSVKDISQMKHQRLNVKKETFRVILKQFTLKIKNIVERGGQDAILKVPQFVLGYPPFDAVFATKYIARQLTRLGYSVSVPIVGTLYVTWKPVKAHKNIPTWNSDPQEDLSSLLYLKDTAKKIRQKK